ESFEKVIEELKKIPEVVECHFITGRFDLFIKLYAANNHNLMNIIHQKLQPLGLTSTETLISFREVFKRQVPVVIEDNK
ncbi:MAG: Lrp/AsnC family transcriptional regulator, partial [Bacteroidales bacterium]|nr:Lrp/AsnC family transcriptional regulator [Bacteroidales bacterium]